LRACTHSSCSALFSLRVVWSFSVLVCTCSSLFFFFFQAEDGIRDRNVTGVQTCALPISGRTTGAALHDDTWSDPSSGRNSPLGHDHHRDGRARSGKRLLGTRTGSHPAAVPQAHVGRGTLGSARPSPDGGQGAFE